MTKTIHITKSKADPKVSQGARLERAAFRNYLRRLYNVANIQEEDVQRSRAVILGQCLEWVLTRQKRYDKESGGLGRKVRKTR